MDSGPTASIIVPTRQRADYLDVALASIAPQAAAAGAELLVVDDGPDDATRAAAVRHGARYVAHRTSRGLNAARNSGIDAAAADLLVFVDDDVEVRPGWLDALLAADAAADAAVGVLTGPIRARFEDHRLRSCGREDPPITTQDHGTRDRDVEHAWGANMTVRRSAIARAGRFDEGRELYGDEQEWQGRLRAAGGRIRYVAAAALDHRRAGDDARLRALAGAAYRRGAASRRFEVAERRAPSLRRELVVLAGCAVHTVRFACPNGIVLTAHSLGRLRTALAAIVAPAGRSAAAPPAGPPDPDFLSGESGTVRGLRRPPLRALDTALDLEARPRLRRIDRAAREHPPRRSVLVLGVERPGRRMNALRAELHRTRHEIHMHTIAMGDAGKFEHLNALLREHPAAGHDWLLVVDDDVVVPARFLDRFLFCAEDAGLLLAQPAHRRHSHAAWVATRRLPGGAVRESRFVEIGPLTAFAAPVLETLLPFPQELRMGWGLDAHWGAVAQERGWRAGIVDATPMLHTAPVGGGYERGAAVAEAQAFLAERPYVTRAQARWSRRVG